MSGPVGIYVHLPFCVHKCLYCDFASCGRESGSHRYIPRYVQGVSAEIFRRAGEVGRIPVESVFFGGGTPTLVDPKYLGQVLGAIFQYFSVSTTAEVTIEANPGTVSPASLGQLRESGFNRLSLGVQSFDNRVLRRLGRIHTAAQAVQAFKWAREAGFANISLDLMYAVPGQSQGSWNETLRSACNLGPEHVSAYSLIVEEGTPFGDWYQRGLLDLPSQDEAAEMMETGVEILEEAGLHRYEISNYARQDFASVHNQIYWENRPYLGFGAAAYSYWGTERWANKESVHGYIEAIQAGQSPVDFTERLGQSGQMGETVMLGLRLLRGVDVAKFRERFGVELVSVYASQIEELLELQLVELTPEYLRLTPRGLDLANQVMSRFV